LLGELVHRFGELIHAVFALLNQVKGKPQGGPSSDPR
jgi:hypothetical protein